MNHTTINPTDCIVGAEKQDETSIDAMRELSGAEIGAVAGGSGYILGGGRSQDTGDSRSGYLLTGG